MLLAALFAQAVAEGGRGSGHGLGGREEGKLANALRHLPRSLAVVRLSVLALQLECTLQQHRSLRVFASPEQRIEEIVGCYQLAFRDPAIRNELVREHHTTPVERMVLASACWIVHPLRAETFCFMKRCGGLLEKLADEGTLGRLAILDAATGKPMAWVAWTAADEQHLAVRREG